MSDLLVYERRPKLVAWFARLAEGYQLREVRSLSQLGEACERIPCALCVEVHGDEILRVADLVHCVKFRARSPVAVLAMPTEETQGYLTPLLEAGVDLLWESVLDHRRVACLLQRAKKAADQVCPREESLKKRVWSQIPWKRYATGSSHSWQKGNNGG